MSSLSEPPRYVPTLTEVVHPVSAPESAFSAVIAPDETSINTLDLLVQRAMQRIDLVLEQRLHEAVEQLMLEYTNALMPRLHEEIERVVRESVTQAF